MKPRTLEQPSLYTILSQPQFPCRFYLQQDFYSQFPIIHLPLNHLLHQSITDIFLHNSSLYKLTKVVINLLDEGRQIIQGSGGKKNKVWLDFLEHNNLGILKNAFSCLVENKNSQRHEQQGIKMAVFAISNFVLRLGINISKSTCFVLPKKNTTNYLSLPTLSIVFLQYLMFILFKGKQIIDDQSKSQYLRQLPKITYIKFSQFINKQQLLLMQISQHEFYSKHSSNSLKSLQYLQFYMQQDKENYKRLTKYDYIHWVNLKQTYNLSTPLSFEIIFLFRTIYMKVIKDFNPDMIIFVEDWDWEQLGIESKVRALLLQELMEEIHGNIFFIREVGPAKKQSDINRPINPNKMEKQQQIYVQSSQPTNIDKDIARRVDSLPLITYQIQRQLDIQQQKLIKQYKQYRNSRQKKVQKYSYQNISKFDRVKQILTSSLSLVGLCMAQHKSFEQIYLASHSYKYSTSFLYSVFSSLCFYWNCPSRYLKPLISQSSQNSQSFINISLQKVLTHSQLHLRQMIANQSLNVIKMYKRKPQVWDWRGNTYVEIEERVEHDDQIVVDYGKDGLFKIFLFRIDKWMLFWSTKNQLHQTGWINIQDNIRSRCSTYLVTGKYIYKGFGISLKQQPRKIYRKNYIQLINNPKNAYKHTQWQQLKDLSIPLISKSYGWAIYDSVNKNAIFMGGFSHNCQNENRINKLIHICSQNNDEIIVCGKTNSEIFIGSKRPQLKIPLYPFIMGIPLKYKQEHYVLCTNGLMSQFSNANNLYLCAICAQKLKSGGTFYGISSLIALSVPQQQQKRFIAIAIKRHIIHYIVNGYRITNHFDGKVVMETQHDGQMTIELIYQQGNLGINVKALRQDAGFKQQLLYFNHIQV